MRAGSSISPQFPSVTNAAHAMATRISDIYYHADRHEQWKRAASPVFLVKDLELALALKNASRPITGLERAQ